MANWRIKDKVQGEITLLNGLNPVLGEILWQRGISSPEEAERFFHPDFGRDLNDPFLFSEMKKAVDRIAKAIGKKEKVVIFGDYDADGVTAVAVLKKTFEVLGLESEVYIPHKENEGYGMNLEAVDEFEKSGISLIVTVDCGISNREEIARAKKLGIDVIVTDHHHVPEKIPEAYAIINPKRKSDNYPFRELAGVGVAFKLAQALCGELAPQKAEQLKWFLDFVAVGTIADCVPLVGENRTIARYGLLVLGKTRSIGFREMFAVGRIVINENSLPDSHQVSFQIAPRLNAAGRMDHANVAFNLIMESDVVRARSLALELEAKNQERQKVTGRIVEEVRVMANAMFGDKKFIFAVGEHFPSGILGLAAGKIADEFGKPTGIFQRKGEEVKGSFRSIPQVNIIEMIEKCGDLLEKYGGHSQAAGIVIQHKNCEAFFQRMNDLIEEALRGKEISSEILIDVEVFPKDVDFDLAEGLEKFEPFGEGNKEPVFLMKNLLIREIKLVGNGEKHLKLFLGAEDGSPKIFEAIGFGLAADNLHLEIGQKVDIVFNLGLDEWNGNKKMQLKLIDIKLVGKE